MNLDQARRLYPLLAMFVVGIAVGWVFPCPAMREVHAEREQRKVDHKTRTLPRCEKYHMNLGPWCDAYEDPAAPIWQVAP